MMMKSKIMTKLFMCIIQINQNHSDFYCNLDSESNKSMCNCSYDVLKMKLSEKSNNLVLFCELMICSCLFLEQDQGASRNVRGIAIDLFKENCDCHKSMGINFNINSTRTIILC